MILIADSTLHIAWQESSSRVAGWHALMLVRCSTESVAAVLLPREITVLAIEASLGDGSGAG